MIIEISEFPSFAHLKRLTTSLGLYEHALLDEPRPEHGYCVDDTARALVLLCREPQLSPATRHMLNLYLDFTLKAISEDGACHNRMDANGLWMDKAGRGDWWGRAAWGLGFAAVHAPEVHQRSLGLEGFRLLSQTTSPDLKAISFAALGAGEFLLAQPNEESARRILIDARPRLTTLLSPDWIWPESRLGYSNASIAEAAMLTGLALKDTSTLNRGILMLDFLLGIEIRKGHLSLTPVHGRGRGETQIEFDQQPIEVAAIADACARAWTITGDPRWIIEIERAWDWFLGDNDVSVPMFDPLTGAGYDGLHARGPNQNRGAESTLAMLSTAQQFYLINRPSQ